MGFREEIVKSRRKIAPYLHFAHALNPYGVWEGPADRLYAAADEGSGPMPMKGHVLSFGSFSRSIASAIFSLEIPGTSSMLVDEDLDWRTYNPEPYDALIRKWIHYLIRVHDDEDLPFDATVALGQIQTFSYPPARKFAFTTSVAPPDLMGMKIPHRTITQDDWPTAPPESLGRGVPIIYGRNSNAVRAFCPPVEEEEALMAAAPAVLPRYLNRTSTPSQRKRSQVKAAQRVANWVRRRG